MFQDETGLFKGHGWSYRTFVLGLISLGIFASPAEASDIQRPKISAATTAAQHLLVSAPALPAVAAPPGRTYFSVDDAPDIVDAIAPRISLLDWIDHRASLVKPAEQYDRRMQFGTWRVDTQDDTCLDVRGLVLQRDSQAGIATRESRDRCVVVAGQWQDPYTGQSFSSAGDMAIDHVVPLKNAYDNGAWRWNEGRRCMYFNFLGDPRHLRAVWTRENASKSDSSPAHYMPSLPSAQCKYLKDWLSIKLTWDLAIPTEEGEAIHEHIRQAGCREDSFTISQAELQALRQAIHSGSTMCQLGQFR